MKTLLAALRGASLPFALDNDGRAVFSGWTHRYDRSHHG
jgi:hypothetical protein